MDFYKEVGVGATVEILDSFPAEADGAQVRCEIYRRSDGYYWKSSSSSFTSGAAFTTMTRLVAKTWRVTYKPPTADTYIINIYVEGNLRNIQYHIASGGLVAPGGGTGYTRSQLIDRWEAITHDDSYVTDHKAVIVNMLNMAINDIGRENNGHWRFLEDDSTLATVASQTTPYSLDSDVNDIIDMRIESTERKIHKFPGGWLNWIRNYPKHKSTGTPSWYILYGTDANGYKQVHFYLWPSSVLTIYYEFYKIIGTLDADGDIPEIPPPFQSLIAIRAAWYHVLSKDKAMAQLLDEQYKKGISDMLSWNGQFIDSNSEIPYNDLGISAAGSELSEDDFSLS